MPGSSAPSTTHSASSANWAWAAAGSVCRHRPQNTPTIEQPFKQREVGRELWDRTGGEPDDEQPALPRHGAQALAGDVAAHGIEHDIGAGAACGRLDVRREAARPAVDDDVVGADCRAPESTLASEPTAAMTRRP